MRIPASWLADYVSLEMPLAELASRLSVACAEVEKIEQIGVAPDVSNRELFRVGKVLSVSPHPNADRLRLTTVDLGEGDPRAIVCGASNFDAGATVAVALPGALLPDGVRLEQRKVRGELSDGMILAEDELGLGNDHSGIMLLPPTLPGTPLEDVLVLTDSVLVVEATGNRPDLQSVYGLAREVAALYGLPLAPMPGTAPSSPPPRTLPITVDDVEGCPRYVGRLFEDVTVAPSPQWLRGRLFAAGVRSISNVVDVTNYVMLALGSPLHAFDYPTLAEGRIVVRRALPRETLTTLDGVERELSTDDLVIADGQQAIALAGIMGGAETEITATTATVLLEAANFEPYSIFRSSERQRLRTEASGRWEKGVDPQLAGPAASYATELVVSLSGGRWVAETDCRGELPAAPRLSFDPQRTDALLGLETEPATQYALLESLGFERSGAEIVVPSWRARDVTREVDLIEEVARFRLDEIPFTLPARREMFGTLRADQLLRRRVEDVLVGLGFSEVYTPSLVAVEETPWVLPDPISVELSALRTSLLPSLLDAVRRNLDSGARTVALFELARVYLPGGELPEERVRVAAVAQGGFLHIKGAVEALHRALRIAPSFSRSTHPLFHPGRTATTQAGVLGELHPRELEGAWGAFELDLADLFALVAGPATYLDVITYPAIREDLALVVREEVTVGDLVAAAMSAAGDELREIDVFDVYRGEQVEPGHKSVAFSLVYQSAERTLTEDDAARLRERILAVTGSQLGARLRSL